ncbi:MAG: coproporphyrinogen dehydrogenase HemZ [Oscillospiraceae bacterium]|nr:coproporphyrinogen dehydrogenase HemZ [Oscillospiraceae bacterium]
MQILNIGHSMHYEMECLAMLFLSGEKIERIQNESEITGDYLKTTLEKNDAQWVMSAELSVEGNVFSDSETINSQTLPELTECERTMGRVVYRIFSEATGKRPKWGILTGIRPVKLFRTRMAEGMTEEETAELYRTKCLVDDEKIQLALATAREEEKIVATNSPESFSLYISIPFCPSRCHYCSFVSHDIASPSAKKLIAPYVEKLAEEIRATGKLVKQLGLRLETVYFGGGTPTTLTAQQLEFLCSAVSESFDMTTLREYTVEAGRPDTITREKLETLKKAGVTRISINPQTLNDEVLKGIGRKHTAQQVIDCFEMAREIGFDNINMDLIAGLMGDDLPSFERTIEQISQILPENVTVHTLSVKRSADYGRRKEEVLAHDKTVEQMVQLAQRRFMSDGYLPYYLYKQKNTLANLENTGYSKQGKECLYNVLIMEEIQTILAVGAGASTKLCFGNGKVIERVYNYKYPYEYVNNFDEILRRKERLISFYNENAWDSQTKRG